MVLAEWKVGEFVWAIFWLTLFFIWIWLLISVFADIFRSDDLRGVSKFLWLVFVIVAPYLGVFAYLIIRGDKMGARAVRRPRSRRKRPGPTSARWPAPPAPPTNWPSWPTCTPRAFSAMPSSPR